MYDSSKQTAVVADLLHNCNLTLEGVLALIDLDGVHHIGFLPLHDVTLVPVQDQIT